MDWKTTHLGAITGIAAIVGAGVLFSRKSAEAAAAIKEAAVLSERVESLTKELAQKSQPVVQNATNGEAINIKTMQLYSDCARVYNNLREIGVKPQDALDVNVLCKYDQYHYHGAEAVAEAATELALTSDDLVLDIGSGLGGPARCLASSIGCHVTAVELQPDLNATAAALTLRCGSEVSSLVRCVNGDMLTLDMDESSFDVVVSWLVFLHINDKRALFTQIARTLKPGGRILFEDFFALSEFTPSEAQLLKEEVFCAQLPTKQEYEEVLSECGFEEVTWVDMTEDWTQHTGSRTAAFLASKAEQTRIHGQATADNLERFYVAVSDVFKGGNLGGCKVSARLKADGPAAAEAAPLAAVAAAEATAAPAAAAAEE